MRARTRLPQKNDFAIEYDGERSWDVLERVNGRWVVVAEFDNHADAQAEMLRHHLNSTSDKRNE